MTTMSVQRVGFACGARVTGIDLSRPLPDDAIRAIHTAWLKHLVLVFPTLVEFTRRFGQLDDYAFNRHPDINEVMVITNKRTNGRPSKTYNNGQNWHTDLSYTLRPAKAPVCTAWKGHRSAATPCLPICTLRTKRCHRTSGRFLTGSRRSTTRA